MVTPPHLIANVWICRDSIAGPHHEPLIINVPEALFEKQSDDSVRTMLIKTLVAVLNFATACHLPKITAKCLQHHVFPGGHPSKY